MVIRCSQCGKAVSQEFSVTEEIAIRAFIKCPECAEKLECPPCNVEACVFLIEPINFIFQVWTRKIKKLECLIPGSRIVFGDEASCLGLVLDYVIQHSDDNKIGVMLETSHISMAEALREVGFHFDEEKTNLCSDSIKSNVIESWVYGMTEDMDPDGSLWEANCDFCDDDCNDEEFRKGDPNLN